MNQVYLMIGFSISIMVFLGALVIFDNSVSASKVENPVNCHVVYDHEVGCIGERTTFDGQTDKTDTSFLWVIAALLPLPLIWMIVRLL